MAKFLIFALCCISLRSLAHPLDLGILRTLEKEKSVELNLDISLPMAAQISGLSEDKLKNLGESLSGVFFATTFSESDLQASANQKCLLSAGPSSIQNERLQFSLTAQCEAAVDQASMTLTFLKRAPANFELIVKLTDLQGTTRDFTLSSSQFRMDFHPENSHSWGDFISLGIAHIGAVKSEWVGPNGLHLPDGIDHILFVIALVLGSGQLLNVFKTVTGFTLGHSVTLALATLQIIHVPSRLVESCIALSIAFVAAEVLWLKRSRSQWRLAFAFGLIHGLGFAAALTELHLERGGLLRALLGFNIGVELGQMVIVLVSLPIILLINHWVIGRRWITPAFALAIFLMGSYWFIQRAFA